MDFLDRATDVSFEGLLGSGEHVPAPAQVGAKAAPRSATMFAADF